VCFVTRGGNSNPQFCSGQKHWQSFRRVSLPLWDRSRWIVMLNVSSGRKGNWRSEVKDVVLGGWPSSFGASVVFIAPRRV